MGRPWWRRRLSPFEIRFVSWLGWLGVSLLCRTLRFRVIGEENLPQGQGTVILVWHGQQLLGFYFFRQRQYAILSSLSRDGDISSSILRRFGWKIVRGSSTRGGAQGLIELIRHLRQGGTVGITPDGPSGPIYHIEPGAVYMSQKTGSPLFPVAFIPDQYWEFNSWDRFIIPKPFSRCIVYYGNPLAVPAKTDPEAFESWKETIAAAIHESNRLGREELEKWV